MEQELKRAYRYCRDLARRKAGNFYYAFVFLPREKRRAIYALYAFCQCGDQLADDSPAGVQKRDLSELKAQFESCLRGEYHSPLFRALHHSIKRYNLPIEHFYRLMEGMESDLVFRPFATFAELKRYCYNVASTVGLLCVEIFGYRDLRVRLYAENLGIALQLTNILRDLGEDSARGRVYLPLEDLDKFNYQREDLLQRRVNGEFLRLMEFQYQRAVGFYETAEANLPSAERKSQLASEIMKAIYRELLEEIRRKGFRVFEGRFSLNPVKKIILALYTYFKVAVG